jgi:hypothetical protein
MQFSVREKTYSFEELGLYCFLLIIIIIEVFNEGRAKRYSFVKRAHIEIYCDNFVLFIGSLRTLIIRMYNSVFKIFLVLQIFNIERLKIFVEVEAWMSYVL